MSSLPRFSSLLLLSLLLLLPTSAQAGGLTRNDRAALRGINRITNGFLSSVKTKQNEIISRRESFKSFFRDNRAGQRCLDDNYYLYQAGGAEPAKLRTALVDGYKLMKYAYASQPLLAIHNTYLDRLNRYHPKGMSSMVRDQLNTLRRRTELYRDHLGYFDIFNQSGGPSSEYYCTQLHYADSNDWGSIPTVIRASDSFMELLDRMRRLNDPGVLRGLSYYLSQIGSSRRVISYIQNGGLGLGFPLFTGDTNAHDIMHGTPNIRANQAAQASLSAAEDQLSSYFHSHGQQFCDDGDDGVICTAELADALNSSYGPGARTHYWVASSTATGGGVGSPTPRSPSANEAADQTSNSNGVNDTPCVSGVCNNPRSVYIESAVGGDYGGATICVGSRGTKNYCAALIVDQHTCGIRKTVRSYCIAASSYGLGRHGWTLWGEDNTLTGDLAITEGDATGPVPASVTEPVAAGGNVVAGLQD